jgi:FkbM family methyltransferase
VGFHDERLTKLVDFYSKNKFSDFFIDIGANVGLVSSQNGKAFQSIFMFEPNPYCFKILEVNAAINLDPIKCYLYNFGLWQGSYKTRLKVPKHNWGGAFIQDNFNSYNDDLLAHKDGFSKLTDGNYFNIDIQVKDTATQLSKIFQGLIKTKNARGVIKIDVEGYEKIILLGIAKALPPHVKLKIIFESFDTHFDMKEIRDCFKRDLVISKLTRKLPWKKNASGLIRAFSFKTSITTLNIINDNNYQSDLVIEIN